MQSIKDSPSNQHHVIHEFSSRKSNNSDEELRFPISLANDAKLNLESRIIQNINIIKEVNELKKFLSELKSFGHKESVVFFNKIKNKDILPEMLKFINNTRFIIPESCLGKEAMLISLLDGVIGLRDNINLVQAELDKNELTSGFPTERLWMLFIDKDKWDLNGGLYTFENEPGYIKALFLAFYKMKDIIDGMINFEKIDKLHKICIENVRGLNSSISKITSVQFKEEYFNFSFDGIKELLDVIKISKYPYIGSCFISDGEDVDTRVLDIDKYNCVRMEYLSNGEPIPFILTVYHNHKNNEIPSILGEYCNDFERSLQKIKIDLSLDDDEKNQKKLYQIVKLCRNIQFTHPFEDGNARTIGCILLNGLLLREHLSPSLIPYINAFDGYSIKELVDIVIAGQFEFQKMRNK